MMIEDTLSILLSRKESFRSPYLQDFLPLVYKDNTKVANPVTLVEKVLISKLKAGDYPAFSSIFTAYYQDLVVFATRFTHDLNHAEEIVQDTFVRLWEDHKLIKVTISLKAYLLKMVQNKCIDWYRHKKIMQMHYNSVMESSSQFIYDTDSYILHSELQEQIEIALGMLPQEISETFQMSRTKGLKYHEIADLLGVSVRTIEVRIGKALHMLRNHLREYFTIIIGTIIIFANM